MLHHCFDNCVSDHCIVVSFIKLPCNNAGIDLCERESGSDSFEFTGGSSALRGYIRLTFK